MRIAAGISTASSLRWLAVLFLCPVPYMWFAAASETDYLLDSAERAPEKLHISAKHERQAEAMAHYVTGIIDEESAGPEKALADYRQVLDLDPGYTKLAIEVAYDYLRRNDTGEAIGVLKDAIKARPQDPDARLALASVYLRHLRKPDLAERFADSALNVAPGDFAGYEMLWEIAQAEGDASECNKVIERALHSKSPSVAFWLQLGQFLVNSTDDDASAARGQSARLTACLEKAASYAGTDAAALAHTADLYMANRQAEEAVDLYRKAADLKPALANLNERLAAALIEAGRKDDAIPILEKVIAGNPLNVAAYDQLYHLYQERGNREKALANVEQALIIDKENLVRQRDYMFLLMSGGHFEKAAMRAEDARRLFPHAPFFTYVEARALAALDRNQQALQMFDRAAAEAADTEGSILNGAFYYDYACAAEQAGDSEKAAQLFQKAIDLSPDSPDAYNALGYLWTEQKHHLDEAERLIRKALSLDPNNGAFLDSLGWLFYQRGQYDMALAELALAVKAMPGPDAVVYEHLGDTYRALNRTAEALLYWQKAIQLDPKNKTLSTKVDTASDKIAEKPN